MALTVRWISLIFVALVFHDVSASHLNSRSLGGLSQWGIRPRLARETKLLSTRIAEFPRGGADVDEEDEEYDDEYDDEEEESEEVEEAEDESEGVQIEVNVEKYDEPLLASPMTNLYVSLGVMLLARRINLFSPKIVRLARFAFIAYLVLLQIFLLYVRIKAKTINDRTPITLKNPLSSVLESQLDNGGGNGGMMKNLASSFLSSKSTVLEYDLKQARSMQSGLIINMAFMWFLHFKMEQVQPLLIQSVTGVVNMIYSPLFQIYVMGRNLERPFKNPAMKKIEEAASAKSEEKDDESMESVETVDAAKLIAAEEAESGDETESESEEEEMIEAGADAQEADEETEADTAEEEEDEEEEEESEAAVEDEESEDVSVVDDAEEASEEAEDKAAKEESDNDKRTDTTADNEGVAEAAGVEDEEGAEEE